MKVTLSFRRPVALLCVLVSAVSIWSHATETQVLFSGAEFADWDTGRTAQRLAKEFSHSDLSALPENGGLRWEFVSREVRFNGLFYRCEVRRPFSVLRFRVRNIGAELVLTTKGRDASGAEWTGNRVHMPAAGDWCWIEFPWDQWHVASWSKDADGKLDLPLDFITLTAFDIRPGSEYCVELSRVEAIQPTPPTARLMQLDIPSEMTAGQSFTTPVSFMLDRPCRLEETHLVFRQGRATRFRVPVTLPVRLSEARPGETIATVEPAAVPIPQYAYGGRYSVALQVGEAHVLKTGKIVDEEVAVMTVHARTPRETIAKVQHYKGKPTFFINDEPHSGMAYTAYHPEVEVFTDFARAGVNLYSFSATPTEAGYGLSKTTWIAPGVYDYSQLDERIFMILEANPDAYVFPRLYLHAPRWWSERHPDDIVRMDPGTGEPVPFIHSGNLPAPSWASEAWRRDTIDGLRRLIAHVKAAPYSDRVVGYHIASGTTEEWMMWGANEREWVDYSPANTAKFQAWLTGKYKTDAELRKAWGVPDITLATASIPSRASRVQAGLGTLRDPAKEQAVIDFYLYNSWLVADTICAFAKVVKEATSHQKAVGVFYGYLLQLCGGPRQQNAGHLALGEVLACEDVDFLCSPTSYAFRQLGGEGTSHFMSLLGSTRIHGKLWFDENDIRTSLVDCAVGTWGRPEDVAGDILQQDKELANVIVNGAAQWWFDVGRNRYDDPKLMGRIGELTADACGAIGLDRTAADEVGLVVDEKSLCYLKVGEKLGRELLLDQLPELHRIGAPVGHYLASDLRRLRSHKMLILATSFAPDREQRRSIEHLKSRGRILVFNYGAGLYRDGQVDEAAMAEFTGIRVKLDRERTRLRARLTGPDPLVKGLEGVSFGPGRTVDPVFIPNDLDAVIVGAFEDGRPAVAVKRFDNWTAVYSAVPLLNRPLLRRIAECAGVHLYIDTPDVVWASRDLLGVTVHHGGRRRIRLPEKRSVTDFYAGDAGIVADAEEFEAVFPERATRVFRLK